MIEIRDVNTPLINLNMILHEPKPNNYVDIKEYCTPKQQPQQQQPQQQQQQPQQQQQNHALCSISKLLKPF